jgi:hypothetical protein
MDLRRSSFTVSAAAIVLALLTACSDADDPAPANTAGAPAAGASPFPVGSGGLGSAGASAAGSSGSGSGGASSAGIGGAAPMAGASGSGTSGSGSAIPATFATIKLVFGGGGGIMTCAAAPCHGVGGVAPPDKPLELPTNNDPLLHANLLSYVSKACNDTKLVTPGNPAQSALLTILKGPCGMTPRMPYGCDPQAGDCIPDDYIAAVSQWIANGAPQ